MQRLTTSYTDMFDQTVEFGIPEPHKKICINVSGGADSALLLWMLITYCEECIPDAEIHVVTSANPIKGWYNAKWSAKTIDRILELTGSNLIKSHYTFYSDDQRRIEIDAAERILYKLNGITLTINGTTQNPPAEVEHLLIGRYEPRDVGHGRPTFSNLTTKIVRWMPVMNVDKRMIAYLYNYFNLTNTLLPFTRSCEQAAIYNNDSPNWMITHCGECWWCKERAWAFEEIKG